jgi:hypothetical protein
MKALKNIIITHLVMLVLFSGAAMALAQEDTSTSSSEDIETASPENRRMEIGENISDRQDQIEERRTEIQTTRAENRTQLEARAQTRILNLAANMSNRMEAILTRLQNITDRIETRIVKLNELGVDTTEAGAALASAQLSIDAAMAEIANIDTEVSNAIGSEDVRTSWNEVKEIYRRIHDHILTARTELRATVAALKSAVSNFNEGNNGVSEAVENEVE